MTRGEIYGWDRAGCTYIQPTFLNTTTPIPDEIVQLLTTYTAAQGLTVVPAEQADRAVIALGAVGHDPEAATIAPPGGPTIQISLAISGTECGASLGIGYLLTATDAGWRAQQYVQAVC